MKDLIPLTLESLSNLWNGTSVSGYTDYREKIIYLQYKLAALHNYQKQLPADKIVVSTITLATTDSTEQQVTNGITGWFFSRDNIRW
jgi:hypothetical protein